MTIDPALGFILSLISGPLIAVGLGALISGFGLATPLNLFLCFVVGLSLGSIGMFHFLNRELTREVSP